MKDYGFNDKSYLITKVRNEARDKLEKYIPNDEDVFLKDVEKLTQESIDTINYIVSKDDKLLYIGLWTQVLCFVSYDCLNALKTRCSKEAKEYIETIQDLLKIWENAKPNPCDEIELERVKLVVPTPDDDYLYIEEMKRTGDYKPFSSLTIDQIYELKILEKPLSFAIYLKEENKMIGAIELVEIMNDMKAYYLQYYVFEEYRHCGYATEAINGLVDAAFSGKLKVRKRTPYRYLSLIENTTVRFIRCTVYPDNEASTKTARKCGFEFELTHKSFTYDYNNEKPIDVNFYVKVNKDFTN